MRVLIACEFSGVVRDAFVNAGHDAWSNDLEDNEPEGEHPNYHLYGNCLDIIAGYGPWDLLIAHPPCTYLCNSGVRWLYQGGKGKIKDPLRWQQMRLAAKLFRKWNSAIPHVAIENPIMHGYASTLAIDSRPPDQTIQPWQFGHGETKATCLWLRNLPPLKPTEIAEGRLPRVHYASPAPDRWKERSRTMPGIAKAMVEQWGNA